MILLTWQKVIHRRMPGQNRSISSTDLQIIWVIAVHINSTTSNEWLLFS